MVDDPLSLPRIMVSSSAERWTASLQALRQFLDRQGSGPIGDAAGLVDHLGPAWDDLAGARDHGMESWKLSRLKASEWSPPTLSFSIERHGSLGLGGTRAELQWWTVNLDTGTASAESGGYRQVRQRAPNFDAQSAADAIVGLIIDGVEDERLKWSADRRSVRVLVKVAIPSGYSRTTAGRRERLENALRPLLEAAGWHGVGTWRYERDESAGP